MSRMRPWSTNHMSSPARTRAHPVIAGGAAGSDGRSIIGGRGEPPPPPVPLPQGEGERSGPAPPPLAGGGREEGSRRTKPVALAGPDRLSSAVTGSGMSETPSATHNAALFSEQRRRLLARLAGLAIRPHWRVMIGVLACMALVAGLTGAIAWLLQPVIDDVFVARNRAMLVPVAVAVVAVFLTRSLASYGQDAMLAWVGQRVLADLQSLLFRHMLGQDVALLQSRHSGTLVSHFTYDVNLMRSAVSNALVGIGRDSLSVVCLAAVMFGQDWRLTLVTLAVAPFTTWPIQRLAKRLRRVSGGIQDEMGRLNTTLSQGFRVIKSFAMEDHEARRAEAVIDRLFRLNVKSAQMGAAVQPIIDAFGGLAVAAVIVYGGLRVIDGATTTGAFFSFFGAVFLAYQPLRSIGKVVPSLQDGLAAADRIFGLLDRAPAIV